MLNIQILLSKCIQNTDDDLSDISTRDIPSAQSHTHKHTHKHEHTHKPANTHTRLHRSVLPITHTKRILIYLVADHLVKHSLLPFVPLWLLCCLSCYCCCCNNIAAFLATDNAVIIGHYVSTLWNPKEDVRNFRNFKKIKS